MNREQTNAKYTQLARHTTPLTDAEYRSLTDDDHTARLLPGEPPPQWHKGPPVKGGQGRPDPDLGKPYSQQDRRDILINVLMFAGVMSVGTLIIALWKGWV